MMTKQGRYTGVLFHILLLGQVCPAAVAAPSAEIPHHELQPDQRDAPHDVVGGKFDPQGSGKATDALAADAKNILVSARLAQDETPWQRLERIAYHLGTANSQSCDNPQMVSGLVLHDLAAYSAQYRDAVEQKFGFGHAFGIRYVIPGSSSNRAGLKRDDIITHVNGVEVSNLFRENITAKASYARIEAFEDLLERAMQAGSVELSVIRHGTTHRFTLSGELSCGGRPVLYPEGGLNAWADGRRVAVTRELLDFAQTDDELAFVLAHEMSHNMLRHPSQRKGKFTLLASFGIGSGAIKKQEIEADALASQMVVTAGYSVDGAVRFLERAGRRMPFYIATTHPGISRRIGIVKGEEDVAHSGY